VSGTLHNFFHFTLLIFLYLFCIKTGLSRKFRQLRGQPRRPDCLKSWLDYWDRPDYDWLFSIGLIPRRVTMSHGTIEHTIW